MLLRTSHDTRSRPENLFLQYSIKWQPTEAHVHVLHITGDVAAIVSRPLNSVCSLRVVSTCVLPVSEIVCSQVYQGSRLD